MKKSMFTSIMVVFVGMIISLFIAYKDIESVFATKFILYYLIFLVLFIIYLVTVTIINFRKLTTKDKRKRFFFIIISFILISCCNFIFYYVKEPSEINFYNIVLKPAFTSFILVLADLLFSTKKNKYY